jgi:hypothetical protein
MKAEASLSLPSLVGFAGLRSRRKWCPAAILEDAGRCQILPDRSIPSLWRKRTPHSIQIVKKTVPEYRSIGNRLVGHRHAIGAKVDEFGLDDAPEMPMSLDRWHVSRKENPERHLLVGLVNLALHFQPGCTGCTFERPKGCQDASLRPTDVIHSCLSSSGICATKPLPRVSTPLVQCVSRRSPD